MPSVSVNGDDKIWNGSEEGEKQMWMLRSLPEEWLMKEGTEWY